MITFVLRPCATLLIVLAVVFGSSWTASAGVVAGMSSQIPASEYGALLNLYSSTHGATWSDHGGWTNPLAATWDGVTVLNGHVAYIELYDNQLTGAVPASLNNLTQLLYLDLSVNSLTGPIPDNWTNLTQLSGLYLSNNSLTGRIPRNLMRLPLQAFDVSFNQLTGPIPEDIGKLTQAQTLEFGYNQLRGIIPPSIGYDINLTYLDVGGNQLTGPIPSTLGNLTQLQELYLEDNLLGGSLPNNLGNLSSLEVLYLGDNHFTGIVPDYTSFKDAYIDLGENYFNVGSGSMSLNNINAMIGAGNTVYYSPQNNVPLLEPLRYTFGGAVQLSAIGLDAQYTVQQSSDLKHWSSMGSLNISNNFGTYQETPTNPRLPGFFRLSITY